MRIGRTAVCLLASLLGGILAANAWSEIRTWRDTAGRELQAEFVSAEGDTVRIRRQDGKEYDVPLANLSEADQAYVRARSAPEPFAEVDPSESESAPDAPPVSDPSEEASETGEAATEDSPEPPEPEPSPSTPTPPTAQDKADEPSAGERMAAAVADWRFYCCVLLVGSILGALIYKATPLPADASGDVDMMKKAVRASVAAKRAGMNRLENIADAVGVAAMAKIHKSLVRQRRIHLATGMVLAVIAMLLTFALAPVGVVPNWGYIVIGVCGAFYTWRRW